MYEASIDTEESERRRHTEEEGEEVGQPTGADASVAVLGGEDGAGPSGETGAA